MKNKSFRYTVLILVVFLFGKNLSAQPEEILRNGNELYQNEKYEEAVNAYGKVIQQGYESAALYYNLANSYYRLGDIGNSILYYEKSLKLNPENEDAKYNLKIAKAHTKDDIKELPKMFITEIWEMSVTLLSTFSWSVTVILLNIFLMFLIGFYLFSKNNSVRKNIFIAGTINLFLLIIFAVMLFARISRDTSSEYGILLKDTITVKSSPDENSNDAFVIHEGIKFSIEDKLREWAKIKLQDGKVGWIQENHYGKI